MNVLIVDDDPDQLIVRKMLLSQFGFDITVASNEASALRAAKTHKPVCAIVDLRMPTEDVGVTLIRNLKTIHPRIRILVLTGGKKEWFESIPERALVEAVIEKGSPASDLLKSLKSVQNPQSGSLFQALERDGAVVVDLKVTPRAPRSEVTGQTPAGVLKVKVAAPPEKGKANEELCRLLSGYFDVRQSDVELISGETSRIKRARIRRS